MGTVDRSGQGCQVGPQWGLATQGSLYSTTHTDPVTDLLLTMGQQERKISSAKGAADLSLKDAAAAKASMLTAVKVMGESSDGEANAQAILDAKAKVDQALTDANAALTALQDVKTKADMHFRMTPPSCRN